MSWKGNGKTQPPPKFYLRSIQKSQHFSKRYLEVAPSELKIGSSRRRTGCMVNTPRCLGTRMAEECFPTHLAGQCMSRALACQSGAFPVLLVSKKNDCCKGVPSHQLRTCMESDCRFLEDHVLFLRVLLFHAAWPGTSFGVSILRGWGDSL